MSIDNEDIWSLFMSEGVRIVKAYEHVKKIRFLFALVSGLTVYIHWKYLHRVSPSKA